MSNTKSAYIENFERCGNMICQKCQQRFAKIHLKQSINGKYKELFLCESCARNENQIQMNGPLFMNDFLGGMISFIHSSPEAQVQPVQCKQCHMKFEDFQKSGRLGCGNCYEVFSVKLDPIIRRLHGNVTYQGKISNDLNSITADSSEIHELQKHLKDAIRKEEYELAAKIRDKIKKLEEKSN